MLSIFALSILVNVALLVCFLLGSFRTRRSAVGVAVLWTVAVVISQYFLVHASGASDPRYRLLIVEFPVILIVGLPLLVSWLFKEGAQRRTVRIVNGFILILLFSITRPYTAGLVFAGVGATDLQEYIHQLDYVVVLLVCVVAPIASIGQLGVTAWSQWFQVSLEKLRSVRLGIGVAVLAALALHIGTNLVFKGFALRFAPGLGFNAFLIVVVTNLFFFTIIDQFVCFVLARKVINVIFPGENTMLPELVVMALLYTLQHYYLQPAFMGRDFLLGLSYAYMYVKSDSPVPGILTATVLSAVAT